MALDVHLVTPEREVWTGEATMVVARGVEGDVGVLKGHAPMLITLAIGPLFIHQGDRVDGVRARSRCACCGPRWWEERMTVASGRRSRALVSTTRKGGDLIPRLERLTVRLRAARLTGRTPDDRERQCLLALKGEIELRLAEHAASGGSRGRRRM